MAYLAVAVFWDTDVEDDPGPCPCGIKADALLPIAATNSTRKQVESLVMVGTTRMLQHSGYIAL